MNDFNEAFSGTFSVSAQVFGDDCVIGTTTYRCVILDLNVTTKVDPNRPGRVQEVGGTVEMNRDDWVASAATKGAKLTVGGGTFRVVNDPLAGPTSMVVFVQLGPIS